MVEMTVRYNPIIGGILLALGVVNVLLGFWLLALGGNGGGALISGLPSTAVGALFLVRTYFTLERSTVVRRALVGPMIRDFRYVRFTVDGNHLYGVDGDGGRHKIPVSRWQARRADWDALPRGDAAPG